MKYFGKHLNNKRDSSVKYGWMISEMNDGDSFLFKFIKRTPHKELYYEKITDEVNVLQVKKNIEEADMGEEFYRYMGLTDILKKL